MGDNSQNELSFEERINANFGDATDKASSATAERLKEVNKKLPNWNLEPPMNFIK